MLLGRVGFGGGSRFFPGVRAFGGLGVGFGVFFFFGFIYL